MSSAVSETKMRGLLDWIVWARDSKSDRVADRELMARVFLLCKGYLREHLGDLDDDALADAIAQAVRSVAPSTSPRDFVALVSSSLATSSPVPSAEAPQATTLPERPLTPAEKRKRTMAGRAPQKQYVRRDPVERELVRKLLQSEEITNPRHRAVAEAYWEHKQSPKEIRQRLPEEFLPLRRIEGPLNADGITCPREKPREVSNETIYSIIARLRSKARDLASQLGVAFKQQHMATSKGEDP